MTDKLRAVEPEAGPRPSKRKRRNSIFFYAYGQFRKDYPEYAETPFEDLNPAARNEVNSRMKELRKAKKALDAANKRGENKRPAIPCPEQTSNFPLPAETVASNPERAPEPNREELCAGVRHRLGSPRIDAIPAIKWVREKTGWGLVESKFFVDRVIADTREAATPSPDTCPHKMLKRQNVGNQHWYRCPECQQKFIASDWDGKVEAGAPSPAPVQPPKYVVNFYELEGAWHYEINVRQPDRNKGGSGTHGALREAAESAARMLGHMVGAPSPVVPNSAGVSPVSAKVERTGAEVLIRPQERGISADHKEKTMQVECFADKQFPNDWRVEAIDAKTGDCYVTVFSGPDAEKRAQDYATEAPSPAVFSETSFGKLVQEIIELKAEIERLKDALFEANRRNDG